jgi:hypothetical protein
VHKVGKLKDLTGFKNLLGLKKRRVILILDRIELSNKSFQRFRKCLIIIRCRVTIFKNKVFSTFCGTKTSKNKVISKYCGSEKSKKKVFSEHF